MRFDNGGSSVPVAVRSRSPTSGGCCYPGTMRSESRKSADRIGEASVLGTVLASNSAYRKPTGRAMIRVLRNLVE
jgi:hypothetical protein